MIMTENLIQILNLTASAAGTIISVILCAWYHYHFFDKL